LRWSKFYIDIITHNIKNKNAIFEIQINKLIKLIKKSKIIEKNQQQIKKNEAIPLKT